MATLGGEPTSEIELDESGSGPWFGRVRLQSTSATIGSRVVIVVDGQTWRGTVVGGQMWANGVELHVVAGAGQLDRPLRTPIHRSDDAGVKLSYVLGALAGATGETIQLRGTDRSLGNYWTILGTESAAEALDRIGTPWKVDRDGVVRVGTLPAVPRITAQYKVERADPSFDRLIAAPIDPETLNSFQLGSSFEADELERPIVAHDLRIVETGGALRIWVNYGPYDNVRSAMARAGWNASILRSAYPYHVVSEDGVDPSVALVTAQSLYPQISLPDMVRIPKLTGSAGVHSILAPNHEVLIGFEAGDPSRPFVVGYKSNEPQKVVVRASSSIELGTNPTRGIARFEDEVNGGWLQFTTSIALGPTTFLVQHFFPNGTPTGPPLTITLGSGPTPIVSILPISGRIDTASTKGLCE